MSNDKTPVKEKKKRHKKREVRHDVSLFTDHDIYLFREGNHFRLYEKLGSHPMVVDEMAQTAK